MVNFLVVRLLSEEVLREWRLKHTDDTATWKQLHTFLVSYWRSLDDISAMMKPSSRPVDPKPAASASTPKPWKAFAADSSASYQSKGSASFPYPCWLCSAPHMLGMCDEFQALSVHDRAALVAKHKLCGNCFSQKHDARSCTSRYRCRTCNQMHNSLLHVDTMSSPASDTARQEASSLSATAPVYTANQFHKQTPSDHQ